MAGKFMNTTKILGEAVGIQRQDIIDRTEEQIAEGLTGAVILGRFKRGRGDAPMAIHQGNIRGQLGYDPKNPDYIAVQDCLDAGVPSVQVLRLGQSEEDDGSETDPPDGEDRFVISCTPPEVQQQIILNKVRDTLPPLTFNNVVFDIYINGKPAASGVSLLDAAAMDPVGLKVEDLAGNGRKISITPKSDRHRALELRPTFMPSFTNDTDIEEGHVVIENSSFHFCLAAAISEPEVCNCEASWVLIPELTPSVKIGYYDEFVLGIENHVQNTDRSYSANTPVIDLLKKTLTYNSFINHLELIRCDSEGTLLRNKTDKCLTVSVMTVANNSSGIKEPIRYLTSKDLCAYDESEVIPDSNEGACTPTIIPINNNLMGMDSFVLKYSINGGEIKTRTRVTDRTARIHTELVNILAYSEAYLHPYYTQNLYGETEKNFFINYDYPIYGAPAGAGEPVSFEFWVTPGADNCIVTKAFGGDFVLHSCGKIAWTEDKIK